DREARGRRQRCHRDPADGLSRARLRPSPRGRRDGRPVPRDAEADARTLRRVVGVGTEAVMRELAVRRLGTVTYADGLALQQALVEDRRADRIPDTLVLLQHSHVLTLGVKRDAARSHVVAPPDVLRARGVEVHEAGRGGDITYHGPGQLVSYPILDPRPGPT